MIEKKREALIGENAKRPTVTSRGHAAPRGVVTEKPKNFSASWKRLIQYAKPQMPAAVIALAFAAIGSILSLLGPSQISAMTNAIQKGLTAEMDLGLITKLGIALIVLYLLSWLMGFLQHFIMATVSQRISQRLRTDITNKTNRMPLKYFDTMPFGDILSRITNDIDTIGQSLNLSIAQLVTSVTMFLGSMLMMFLTNWLLALTAIGASVLGFFLMTVIMRFSQKHFNRQQRHLGAINGHVEEIYSGHEIVKAFNAEAQNKEEFKRINRHLRDSVFKSTSLSHT